MERVDCESTRTTLNSTPLDTTQQRETSSEDIHGSDQEASEFDSLANSILAECRESVSLSGLDTAIFLFREALSQRPVPHALETDLQHDLAEALLIKFSQTDRREDLDEAIEMLRQKHSSHDKEAATKYKISAIMAEGETQAHDQSELAKAMLVEFNQSPELSSLNTAVWLHRKALRLRSSFSSGRLISLKGLAVSLYARFRHTDHMPDLIEAISALREVVQSCSKSNENHSPLLNTLSAMLATRFCKTGEFQDLYEAASQQSRSSLATDTKDPSQLFGLANNLMTEFGRLGRIEDLEMAITLLREVLSLLPISDPNRSVTLNGLACALDTRFEQSRRRQDVDEAISLHREALELFPAPHPLRSTSVNNLAGSLEARFGQSGERQDLDEMILMLREVLQLPLPPHLSRSTCLSSLANGLSRRYNHLGTLQDRDEAITLRREAFERLPQSHSDRSVFLNSLINALKSRFLQSGERSDLDEEILLLREALEQPPASSRAMYLQKLAHSLAERFSHSNERQDLEEALSLHREALKLLPAAHPYRFMYLTNFASALNRRFVQLGERKDLDEVISLHHEAISLLPVSHPERPTLLDNLANSLDTRFRQLGERRDLEEAILILREVLKVRTGSHPSRVGSLNNLGNSLEARFHQSGERQDLEDAISLYREALTLQPTHPDRFGFLRNLASALDTRFGQSNEIQDMDESVSLHREALSLLPTSHPDRPGVLHGLAIALDTRFGESGKRSDLDEAISLHREALQFRPVPHTLRPECLSTLADSLSKRFRELNEPQDLEEAISLHREELELLPASHSSRPGALNNLATTLFARSGHSSDCQDLNEAISLSREASKLLPVSHTQRPLFLNNLASALFLRFHRSRERQDLDEGVQLLRETVHLLPVSHLNRPGSLNNLALALDTRFRQLGGRQDINEAINLWGESLATLESGHPSSCTFSINLANALTFLYSQTRHSEYLDKAITAFRVAAACEAAPTSQRFRAAQLWIRVADPDHKSALEAYRAAIELLPRLAMFNLDLHSRWKALTAGSDGLARGAAACAIRSGLYDEAVEMLEEGRAVFWSQALQLRSPMDDLCTVAPELGEKLQRISLALEQGSHVGTSSDSLSDSLQMIMFKEKHAADSRRLNDDWLATLNDVRKLNGFEDFLRPSRIATLQASAIIGPVVILNASQSGCAALILDSMKVQQITFPNLTYAKVHDLVRLVRAATKSGGGQVLLPELSSTSADSTTKSLLDTLQSFEDRLGKKVYDTPLHCDHVFRFVLAVLWTTVVEPVIRVLNVEVEKSKSPPHIRWCPTGPFSFLPIHAAGVYKTESTEPISDYVISSYTPTITALLAKKPSPTSNFKMMVVIQPVTPNYTSLAYTVHELQKIRDHVPKEWLDTLGTPETPAVAKEVISRLSTANIVHFACHGEQDSKSPLDSALILHDGPLRVSQIIEQQVPTASLAFLSACQTAMGDENLPDESIHLASSLLFAGFRGVVATMWSIADIDGPKVADTFYENLFRPCKSTTAGAAHPDTTQAARALHLAVAKLRDEGASFLRWVPYIHIGI